MKITSSKSHPQAINCSYDDVTVEHKHPAMQKLKCPVCRTDSYLNPEIKIYVSPCFHKLCGSCLDRVFGNGPAPCPTCKTTLRQANYISQTFEDIEVERECKLRKQLQEVYYMTLDSFNGNMLKYDDYLEDFEDKIENLMSLNDPTTVEKTLKDYRAIYGEQSERNMHEERKEKVTTNRNVRNSTALNKNEEPGEKPENTKYDVFEDVKTVPIYITKKHVIPDYYKINFQAAGFSENMLIFKCVNSLFDEMI